MWEELQASPSRWRSASGFLALAALLLAFLGLSVTGHDPRLLWYQAQTVDALHVTRTRVDTAADSGRGGKTLPLNPPTIPAKTAQALYSTAFSLPGYPFFYQTSCPMGVPFDYHLAFSRSGSLVAAVDLHLEDGCAWVSLAGITTQRVTVPFLQLLAATLGISEDTLLDPIVYPAQSPPPITSLTVRRIGETPSARVSPLALIVTNTDLITNVNLALYQDSAYALVPPASACPPNDGTLYRLTFTQPGQPTRVADIEATGCQLVFRHDVAPPDHIGVQSFWDALASALGMSRASLGVGPQPLYWTTPPLVPHQR